LADKPDSATAPEAPATKESSDFVVIGGPTADGSGLGVLRCREGRLEVGQVQPLREGKSIHGEVVKLHPHADCPAICDVEVQVPAPPVVKKSGRPAQVASDTYRKNWDTIFKRTGDELN